MTIQSILDGFLGLLGMVPPLIIGATVVYFLYLLFKQMSQAGNTKAADMRGLILYGIFVIFVMVSLWGIIQLFESVFFPGGRLVSPGR